MQKVTKAVIPTAGLGTRFLPVTKAVPKSMLPILDTPTVDYIVDEAVAAGITDIIIITSHNTDVIERHFAENLPLEKRLVADGKTELYEILKKITSRAKITFVKQDVLNGLAGALLCAEDLLAGEPFALLLGDEVIYTKAGQKPCIRRLCEAYEKTGKTVLSTMRVEKSEISKYGNIGVKTDGDIKEVYALKEKPAAGEELSDYAIIGRYVLDGDIFKEIRKLKMHGSEIILTDAFQALAERGEIVASEFEGIRYDVGDKAGYVQANVEYALRDGTIGEKMKKYIAALAEKL